MGAYHTIDLELNKDFTLSKLCWDVMSLERIDIACNVEKQADAAAVRMLIFRFYVRSYRYIYIYAYRHHA
jgi:stalled ribosome rescue protein Dom34